jgi:hypothetical protein
MTKNEEKKLNKKKSNPSVVSSKNLQAKISRIKQNSLKNVHLNNETTDSGEIKIPNENVLMDKTKKSVSKTKSLQEKKRSVKNEKSSDNSDFEQIFDPSVSYEL